MSIHAAALSTPRPAAADPAGDALLAGLDEMTPRLRARGAAAEAASRIPEETIEELKALGAFRAVTPQRYGGMEAPYPYIPQIFRVLGRGCTSTAWCMGFLIYHNFQFGHFPLAAQDEVWGPHGYSMAPGQVMPAGAAKPVSGGYELTGRWGYATGILHGDWMLVTAPVERGGEAREMRRFFVPVADCEVLETWRVAAMAATGSHDVQLHGVFAPEHRSMPVADMREARGEGLAVNQGPLWRVPLLSFMVLGAVGPLVGAAEALLEIVTDVMKTKVGAYSGQRQASLSAQSTRLARLALSLDATIRLWEGHIDELWRAVCAGEEVSRPRRQELRAVSAHVARSCADICAELAGCVGSRSYFLDNPIQRFHRDVASLSTHALFDFDQMADLYGAVRLGAEPAPTAMI